MCVHGVTCPSTADVSWTPSCPDFSVVHPLGDGAGLEEWQGVLYVGCVWGCRKGVFKMFLIYFTRIFCLLTRVLFALSIWFG